MDEMPLRQGHRARLRTRVLDGGLGSMPNYELLELLLSYAVPRGDTKVLARSLLDLTSLGGLLSRDPRSLAALPGLGPHTASLLALVRTLHLRLTEERDSFEMLAEIRDSVPWFRAAIGLGEEERFAAFFLDHGRRILSREILSDGSRTQVCLYPRKVFQRALTLKATGFILAHNHPSGKTDPSWQDRDLTRNLADIGRRIEVELIDHIIVTRGGFLSMNEAGLL